MIPSIAMKEITHPIGVVTRRIAGTYLGLRAKE
jgi:hypothetical protein